MLLAPMLLAIGIASPPPVCQDPNPGHHEREAVKHRTAPADPKPVDVTVRDMLGWPVPFVAGWRKAVEAALVPSENLVIRVTGRVRLVKCSADDGDIHAELADTGAASAPRVIVEIPATEPDVQAEFVRIVGVRIGTSPRRFDGDAARAVQVTGWRFLDLSHQGKAPSKSGHGHGSARVTTLWEAHPVFAVSR